MYPGRPSPRRSCLGHIKLGHPTTRDWYLSLCLFLSRRIMPVVPRSELSLSNSSRGPPDLRFVAEGREGCQFFKIPGGSFLLITVIRGSEIHGSDFLRSFLGGTGSSGTIGRQTLPAPPLLRPLRSSQSRILERRPRSCHVTNRSVRVQYIPHGVQNCWTRWICAIEVSPVPRSDGLQYV